jgi:hypothetical protein
MFWASRFNTSPEVAQLQDITIGLDDLIGITGSQHHQARNGAQRYQLLHRLMGRPILAVPHGVMGEDHDGGELHHQPAVIALSRQPLPTFDRSKYASAAGVARGAYVMAESPGGLPDIILIGSGSEVSLVVAAHETLVSQKIRSRVVSMPSWDIFEHQPKSYRESVLPSQVTARVAVEQGSALGWERYVGAAGQVIGMKTFGASAPLKELQRKFGFEPELVVAAAKELLGRT